MSISDTGNTTSVATPLPSVNSGIESTVLLQHPQQVVEGVSSTAIELVSSSSTTAVVESQVVREGGGSGLLNSSGVNSGSRRPGRPRKHGLKNAGGRGGCVSVSGEGRITPPGYTTRSRIPSVSNASSSPPLPVNTSTDSMPPGYVPAPPSPEITPLDTLPLPVPVPPTYVSEQSLPPSSSTSKKRRGRPPGSGSKQQPTQAPPPTPAKVKRPHGVLTARELKPHTIFVSKGEDLVGKIIAFAQQGKEDIFIASHYGAVSSATLRQPASSTGSMTLEGHYDLITLSGSLLQAEVGDKRVWTGGFMATLLGPDNHIVAGGVAGPMIAATPSQVVVVSFILPKEEDPQPGTVNPVNNTMETVNPVNNTKETVSPATRVDVNESAGVGGDACMSIPDNFSGGAGVAPPMPDDFFDNIETPGTSNMMQK